MTVVLDSSALLAFLQREPGHERVADVLDRAKIGSVNAAEVFSKLSDAGFARREIVDGLMVTGIECIAFDLELALASAELRPATRHKSLSLGDRACLALAAHLDARALTTDRSWRGLNVGVEVVQIR
jgi:PIN domain nuclease of toxin-antitoxin system